MADLPQGSVTGVRRLSQASEGLQAPEGPFRPQKGGRNGHFLFLGNWD